jgi:hypothetical protein
MNREIAWTFSLASLSLALLSPNVLQAQDNGMSQPSQAMANDQSGQSEAMEMVPARISLKESIDSDKVKAGDQILAVLGSKIHLKNGKELPAGTQILGIIATDAMQTNGASKLALDFNRAKLKDGTVIPIKATIAGIFPPVDGVEEGYPAEAGDDATEAWSRSTLAVDEIDALPGVDLHSKIESQNSGVLVSTKKHDVKLKYGTQLALAVAAAPLPSAGE